MLAGRTIEAHAVPPQIFSKLGKEISMFNGWPRQAMIGISLFGGVTYMARRPVTLLLV